MKKYFENFTNDPIDAVLVGVAFGLLVILFVTAIVTVPQIAERQNEVAKAPVESTVESTVEETTEKAPQNGAKEKDGVFIFKQPARTLFIDDILF